MKILAVFVALVLLATPVWADEPAPTDPFPVVKALDTQLQSIPDSPDSWQLRWDAYQAVKEELAAERESLAPMQDAWRKRAKEIEGGEALSEAERSMAGVWDAFILPQTRVSTALRRDQLSLGALLMGFFAATLLWGGFAVTVTIALRSEKQKKAAQIA